MQFFRYREDRWPIVVFVVYFALDVVVYLSVNSVWIFLLWFAAGLIPKGCISAWNHHHQHVMTFKQPILNRFLEVMYGFQTGITSNAWVLHHVVGHHLNYMDQEKDESGWKREDGATMGVLEYSVKNSLAAYPRVVSVGLRHKKHMKVFVWMAALQLCLLAGLFWYNWLGALFVFLLPMMASLFLTVYATYKHHSGLDTDNEYEASYNILNPLYNFCTGNLGYHTAHHVKQGLHWSRLPAFHEKIKHKIPMHLYQEPGFPWSLGRTRKLPSVNEA